jgi:hypothetical protein
MNEPESVLEFPTPEEQLLRRVTAEAERLANQPEVERAFRISKSAEALGIKPDVLRAMIHAVLKQRAEIVQAKHLEEDRERQRQKNERRAEDKKQEQLTKAQARERELAKKKADQRTSSTPRSNAGRDMILKTVVGCVNFLPAPSAPRSLNTKGSRGSTCSATASR